MLKVQEIRELIKLIDESSIDEFSYESNGTKVSMKKEKESFQVEEVPKSSRSTYEPVQVEVDEKPVATAEKSKSVATQEVEETAASTNYDHEIVSPMVGTFYSSPTPDSDPFVQKGEKVKSNSVVCIVEAMKLFNEIEAEVNGEIVEVLVENGELVEYGQPLFRVKSE
ncbi:acetyl-CoA carboxylase biotin carboxyl carrier protein [Aquibacillus sp. 3ASR75-11]|uniref:Biotin carboxyl carrier protein of acetyl-CoA carboxylase n=1 Tax=Terrihalobacillus insolitus TaxID=2950438 RepID=A0A9X3WTM7_9BACI|nr:acetyl-CoA carboxylase biotin carboxyl carrier protein [Terrihalobacillus insolitus]MDC3414430.1 acetyl-CoA carboxylase biotin carboxyl carrier protein [Terrihalobacillus insolitus]MDC3425310.1 acetyl-CoA carboxylase biotin carboxyl carrier protein [Terrihalobacillus insolitus]